MIQWSEPVNGVLIPLVKKGIISSVIIRGREWLFNKINIGIRWIKRKWWWTGMKYREMVKYIYR